MKFEKFVPGMTVYDVQEYGMGHRSAAVWKVLIISVDLQAREVIASWNDNKAQRYKEHIATQWRLKEPLLIHSGFCGQYRLATREEIKAAKAKEAAKKATKGA